MGGINGEADHRWQEQQPHDERVPPPNEICHEYEGYKGPESPVGIAPGPWCSVVRLRYEGPESAV